jgi:hypothetical protein
MKINQYEVEVLPNNMQRELEFLNEVVLIMQLENFKVRSQNRLFDLLVNKVLMLQKNAFIRNVYQKLYPQAVLDFKRAQQNDYVFLPYSAYLVYTVTMNQDCAFSYFYDNYTFTGGAHGITVRKSKTYNVKKARETNSWDFFSSAKKGQKIVLEEILLQAEQNLEQNPGIYFDNYKMLIRKNFSTENFFLTPEGIVIYFNQYDIAPYSTGIVEFLVPYSMVDYPPKC